MEVIRLYNPNTYNPYEAYIIEMDGKGYLQIKDLLKNKEVYNGIFKNMDELTQMLVNLCEVNNWYCAPLGKQTDRFTGFEEFYETMDN